MSASSTTRQGARVNPFAFPSDTTFRFILLLVSVIGASLFIYDSLFTKFNLKMLLNDFTRCRPFAKALMSVGGDLSRYAEASAASDSYARCIAPGELRKTIW